MKLFTKGQGKYAHLGIGPMRVIVNGKQTYPNRIYRIWVNMKERVQKPPSWRRLKTTASYLELNLTICDEWLDFGNFWRWAMSHGYSDDLSIDRIDVNGNYEPSNCRWETRTIQSFNRRQRSNKTGHTGIRKSKNGKYEVRISKNNKQYHLGTFSTIEEAVEARQKAERELYLKN